MSQSTSPAGEEPEPDEEHIEAMDRLARAGDRSEPPAPALPRRPLPVLIAVWMSWLGSAVLLFLGATILASRQELLSALDVQVEGDAQATISGIGGFLVAVALVVIVLTVGVFRGGKWAVWVLALVAFVFIMFCLIGVVTGAMAMLVPVLWTVAVLVLYFLPVSGDWFRARRTAQG